MVAQTERRIDEYLVVSARLGDRAAFGRLGLRWQKKLLVHAWRLLGDEEAARDAVQDAWVEIVRGLRRLDDPAAFPAWAFRIVSRRCARHIGRVQRGRRLEGALAAEAALAPVEAPAEGEADLARVRRGMRLLPPGQQAAVALFYLEEMSIGEVAVALDVPTGTIKTRLMHARQKLRAAMMGDE